MQTNTNPEDLKSKQEDLGAIVVGINYMQVEDKVLRCNTIFVKDTEDVYVQVNPLVTSCGVRSDNAGRDGKEKAGEFIVQFNDINTSTKNDEVFVIKKVAMFFGQASGPLTTSKWFKEQGVTIYLAKKFDSYMETVLNKAAEMFKNVRKYGLHHEDMSDDHKENLNFKEIFDTVRLYKQLADTNKELAEANRLLADERKEKNDLLISNRNLSKFALAYCITTKTGIVVIDAGKIDDLIRSEINAYNQKEKRIHDEYNKTLKKGEVVEYKPLKFDAGRTYIYRYIDALGYGRSVGTRYVTTRKTRVEHLGIDYQPHKTGSKRLFLTEAGLNKILPEVVNAILEDNNYIPADDKKKIAKIFDDFMVRFIEH